MVQFRRGLDDDDADLPSLAANLESAVRHALDESANAWPESSDE